MRSEDEIKSLYRRMQEELGPHLDSIEIIQESGHVYRNYLKLMEYVLGIGDDLPVELLDLTRP